MTPKLKARLFLFRDGQLEAIGFGVLFRVLI